MWPLRLDFSARVQGTSLAPAAQSILANPPLAEEIADSPLVDRLHGDPATVAALIQAPSVNDVLNNPAVVAGLATDPSCGPEVLWLFMGCLTVCAYVLVHKNIFLMQA